MIVLAVLAKRVSQGTWTTVLLAGLAGDIGIVLCYALAYGFTDGLIAR